MIDKSGYKIKHKGGNAQGAETLTKDDLVCLTITTAACQIPYQIIIGRKHVLPTVQQILTSMRVGEEWVIENEKSQEMTIKIKSAQHLEPELGGLEKAIALKDKGNLLLKAKDYKQALEVYLQAFKGIEFNCAEEIAEIKLSLLSNLALASLNSGRQEECIKWCRQHFQQSLDYNKKIIYRQAKANKHLKNWVEAKRDVELGKRVCAEDEEGKADFQGLLKEIQKEQKDQLNKQKKVYGKMFG